MVELTGALRPTAAERLLRACGWRSRAAHRWPGRRRLPRDVERCHRGAGRRRGPMYRYYIGDVRKIFLGEFRFPVSD